MDLKLLASNIDAECRKRGTNVNKMLLECGLSKATVDNIKNGSVPGADKLLTIAKYLGVSIDYLLGYSPKAEYDEKAEKFIHFANQYSDDDIDEIINHYYRYLPKK